MAVLSHAYFAGINWYHVDADPRVTAVPAGEKSRITWRDAAASPDIFYREFEKQDDGLSTNVTEVIVNNYRRFSAFPDFNPVIVTEQATVADWDDPANETNWANGTLLTLNTGVIPSGSYQLFPQCIFKFNSTNKKLAFRTVIDGVSLGAQPREVKDIATAETASLGIFPKELEDKGLPVTVSWNANAAHTILLQALVGAGSPGGTQIEFSDCLLQSIKVA